MIVHQQWLPLQLFQPDLLLVHNNLLETQCDGILQNHINEYELKAFLQSLITVFVFILVWLHNIPVLSQKYGIQVE
jgi:hypothetical protein